MTGCDFFTPVQLGDGKKCDHWESFSEKGLMLDPVTLLNAHGVGYDMGGRQAPPLVVVPRHWVTVANTILYVRHSDEFPFFFFFLSLSVFFFSARPSTIASRTMRGSKTWTPKRSSSSAAAHTWENPFWGSS